MIRSRSRDECSPSRVFPVPGGPVSKTPLGVLALSLVYLRASLRQATTSSSSSLAVSSPATSLKVTGGACSLLEAPFLALHDIRVQCLPPSLTERQQVEGVSGMPAECRAASLPCICPATVWVVFTRGATWSLDTLNLAPDCAYHIEKDALYTTFLPDEATCQDVFLKTPTCWEICC